MKLLLAAILLFIFEAVVMARAAYPCENVKPIWNKISGKPKLRLSEARNSRLSISWSTKMILHGSPCIQAFAVEWQHFGHGRRTWTPWSGLAGCAVLVKRKSKREFICRKELDDFDCGRRKGAIAMKYCAALLLHFLETSETTF